MKKIKDVLIIIFCTVFILVVCAFVGLKLHHAYMVDKVLDAISNDYTIEIDGDKMNSIDVMFMTTMDISEYNIKINDDKKIVELN